MLCLAEPENLELQLWLMIEADIVALLQLIAAEIGLVKSVVYQMEIILLQSLKQIWQAIVIQQRLVLK